MTTITTNKLGLDVVDIQVEHTGEAFTDMFFQEPVLDMERDYVVGVSELSVPLSNEPLITSNTKLLDESILEFRLKVDGNNVMLHRDHQAGKFDPDVEGRAHFKLNKQLVVTPVDIVQHLSSWVYTLQDWRNTVAAANAYQITLLSSPSGILRIRANDLFWAHYSILVTDFGKELLGYDQSIIGLVWNQAMAGPSTQVSDLVNVATGIYRASNHPSYGGAYEIPFQYSVFRYIESRLRIEVDADLAIPSNILVENGKHKVHYNIASYALPQKYEGMVSVSNDPVVSTKVSHITHFYTGNTIIKSKDTPTTDWYKLLSAANVQNMRLHLFVVRRDWDIGNKTWTLSRNKLTMSDNSTWFLTLKFVEQF